MEFKVLTIDQARRLDRIEAGAALGDRILAKLIDDALSIELGELPDLGIGNITGLQSALDAKLTATQAAAVADLGTTTDLVGVDGTGSNAAPLAGTEARLDAMEAKMDELLASVRAGAILAT